MLKVKAKIDYFDKELDVLQKAGTVHEVKEERAKVLESFGVAERMREPVKKEEPKKV